MDNMVKKVLIVEDDFFLNQLITNELKKKYTVKSVTTVAEAKKHVKSGEIDFFIIDVNLPDGKGKQIAKEISKQKDFKPFMFLTVNDLEEDYIEGFQMGAIDYMTKPFSMKILLTKIETLLNSFDSFQKIPTNKTNSYKHRGIMIDFSTMLTIIDDKSVVLSPTEYRILQYLTENKGILLSKEQILAEIWDNKGSFIEEHTLVTHISKIRKKIEVNNFVKIRTVYGMGYMFVELEDISEGSL